MRPGDTLRHEHPEGAVRQILDRLTLPDRRLLDALGRRQAPPWIDRILRSVTHLGGAAFSIAVCLGLLALPATRRLGLVTGLATLLSHLLVQLLKRTVVRPRPTASQPSIMPLSALPDPYSFPSGHSCAAMALATSLMPGVGSVAGPVLGLALLVGVSRVYLRIHYPTDVVVGQLLGAASAILAWATLS